jgi:hypothetical protein
VDDYFEGEYNTKRVIGLGESILLNDQPSGNAGATLSVTTITMHVPASDGTLTPVDLAAGTFEFMPVRGFRGNTTFEYQIKDNTTSAVARANVTIYVPPPVGLTAADDYYTGVFNAPFTPTAGQLILLNDHSSNALAQLEVVSATQPSSGTLTSWSPNGSFVFTPDQDWFGTTVFKYTITDADTGLQAEAFVHINITGPLPVPGTPPVAVNDVYRCPSQVLCTPTRSVTANDNSPMGGNLSVTLVSGPSVGALYLRSDGIFNYTPSL